MEPDRLFFEDALMQDSNPVLSAATFVQTDLVCFVPPQ
jgi:hypothetical protein